MKTHEKGLSQSDLEFRWAEPSDLHLVQGFLRSEFGPDSIQAVTGRCEWLYFRNPLGLHVSLCLTPGGDLVGCCGHLPQVVHLDGEDITAGFGIDFMVKPDWRRQGIGKRFLTMRLERFRLSLSVGQSPAMGNLYRGYGAVDLGAFQRGFQRRRPGFSRHPRVTARHTMAWLAGRRAGRAETADWQVAAEGEQTPWQDWRFRTGPYADYTALVPPSSSSGLAFVRRKEHTSLIIALDTPPDNRVAALASVARWGAPAEAQILCNGERLTADCRRAGFFLRDHEAHLVGATLDERLGRRLKPGCLDIFASAGDADLLRRPLANRGQTEAVV